MASMASSCQCSRAGKALGIVRNVRRSGLIDHSQEQDQIPPPRQFHSSKTPSPDSTYSPKTRPDILTYRFGDKLVYVNCPDTYEACYRCAQCYSFFMLILFFSKRLTLRLGNSAVSLLVSLETGSSSGSTSLRPKTIDLCLFRNTLGRQL